MKQPITGDKILVWDNQYGKHEKIFLFFSKEGCPYVVSESNYNDGVIRNHIICYNFWDWPKEPEYIPFDYDDDILGMRVRRKGISEKLSILKQIGDRVYLIISDELEAIFCKDLLENFEQLDGTPCGKLKGE